MVDIVLNVKNLHVNAWTNKGVKIPIITDVSFDVEAGKVIALIGESGSGKTTISLAAMGYSRPGCKIVSGDILLNNKSILDLSRRDLQHVRGVDIAYVAQSAAASFNSALKINNQVTEVPVLKGLMNRETAVNKAIALYKQLELPDPENIGNRYPHQVSGGQLQRLMAAMAMICEPQLLILDEPTTALDVTTQIEVLQAFKYLIHEHKTSAIYVTHDLSLVAQIADKIMVLKDGVQVEYGDTEQIINNPQHDYTKELISAAHVMPKTIIKSKDKTSSKGEPPLLEAKSITAGYDAKQSILVLHGANLTINAGETVGIIGESGSAKTTLGRVISGLMPPKNGEILLEGRPLAASLEDRQLEDIRNIQFAFQMADVALNPRHRIKKILGRPLQFYFGLKGKELEQAIASLLDDVELPQEFTDRYPSELSGGQRQRINLARALAAKPKLIICDEITSALDTIVAKSMLKLLKSLQERMNISYIFITHDISIIAKIADRVLVMRNGLVLEQGPTDQVLTPPHHGYTDLLLNSVPEMRTDWLEGATIQRRKLIDQLDNPAFSD